MEEWLNWHIVQGIEHFYIYDHGSKKPVFCFIKTLSKDIQEKTTVIDFSGTHDFAQHDAYNDCLKKYGEESRWLGFIDLDEMVRCKDGRTVPEFLKEFESYAGLFIVWIVYGADRQIQKLPGSVRERFKVPTESTAQDGIGKVFAQPFYMKQMLTHNGFPIEGFDVVDEFHNTFAEAAAWIPGIKADRICIDHYYTKSYEEWVEKISRGTCDPYFSRKYDEFFKFNPNMEYCREKVFPVQEYKTSNKRV